MRSPTLIQSEFTGKFRWGRVNSVDKSRHSVQVKFEEQDGFISYDLQFLFQRPGDYSLPPTDTMVLCVLIDGRLGIGFVLGCFYTDNDAAPLNDAGKRSIVSDDLRLGASDASDKVALAPATKDEITKVLDYANGIATAIQGAGVVAMDGGASFKANIIAALPVKPTINEPKAEKVSAK